MNNKILEWLQNWFFQNCDDKWEKKQRLLITTIDNPGWLLTLNLEDSNYENTLLKKNKIDRTEHDWCHCLIDNKKFVDAGGPFNLNEILNYFKNFIEGNKEIYTSNIIESEIINWMQKWYYDQCNEDWEHTERFRIKTTDYGWYFSMFLEDTSCENKKFTPVEIKNNNHDWYECFLNKYRFEGKGSHFNLINIINIFRKWVGN